MIGIALAVGLTWTIKNAFFMPSYTAHIMKLKWWTFYPSLIPGVIGTLLVGVFSYWIAIVIMPDNWLSLAGFSALVSIIYALFVWSVGLNHEDRLMIIELLPFKRASKLKLGKN